MSDSVNGGFHGQNVRMSAKTGNLTQTNRRNQRFLTEFLPRKDVGKVDLNGGNAYSRDSVPNGDAGVSISGCV
jgi:hypothetical protein